MSVLIDFDKFLASEHHEMFITGVAGTGKTTSLAELLTECDARGIKAVTCAYTHQAVKVLRSKLPDTAETRTLHSFLKKRPTVNDKATKLQHVDGNSQMDAPDRVQVLFIDEFSMVGEKDYVDIADLQYDDEGEVIMKVVYIGDANQLPPVKDQQVVIPKGPHWTKLTKVHRQAHDNPLIDTLLAINDYINGGEPQPLGEHKTLIRGVDLVEAYSDCDTNKILLAFTNERVESLNAAVQGYTEPLIGDTMFCPTLRKTYLLTDTANRFDIDTIKNIRGDELSLGSKYKTLETLMEMPAVQFFILENEDGYEEVRAAVFGHYAYLMASQALAKAAVEANQAIGHKFGEDPKEWAGQNWSHPMAKARSQAWKNYLSFKDNVVCLDFAHAMTVHKAQGSTYETVFLDIKDLGKCANNDYTLYLKLLYVGISRASERVFTN